MLRALSRHGLLAECIDPSAIRLTCFATGQTRIIQTQGWDHVRSINWAPEGAVLYIAGDTKIFSLSIGPDWQVGTKIITAPQGVGQLFQGTSGVHAVIDGWIFPLHAAGLGEVWRGRMPDAHAVSSVDSSGIFAAVLGGTRLSFWLSPVREPIVLQLGRRFERVAVVAGPTVFALDLEGKLCWWRAIEGDLVPSGVHVCAGIGWSLSSCKDYLALWTPNSEDRNLLVFDCNGEVRSSHIVNGLTDVTSSDNFVLLVCGDERSIVTLPDLANHTPTAMRAVLAPNPTRRNRSKNSRKPISLLFVAASPMGQDAIRAGRELNAVIDALGSRAKVEILFAATLTELSQRLRKVAPSIVHFAGHGDDGHLYFENEAGYEQIAFAKGLANMVREVPLVVLNACLTSTVAEHMQNDAVVASTCKVIDANARSTATVLYQTLAAGYGLERAVQDANAILQTMEEHAPENTFQIFGARRNLRISDLQEGAG